MAFSFPPTRDSAYEGTVKESVAGRGAGGLTMAEQFTSGDSRSQQQSERGGLTMADRWAGQPPAAPSGFESQSGYTRSAYPGEAQDYYNSSAGSSYNRADQNQSSSQNDSSGQNVKQGTKVPGYPPKSVRSEAPAGILKSSAQESNTGRIKYAPAPSSTRGHHAAMPSDASERTQAVGSFLEDYGRFSFTLQ